MKINPISNPNILKSYAVSKPSPAKPNALGGRDEAVFSDEALSFSKALTEAREELEHRPQEELAHIANITAAIRDGSYRVSSEDIAAKILESVFRS